MRATPGPWVYADCAHPEIIVTAKDHGLIARGIYPSEQGRANAKLITAAPDLADALEEIVSYSDTMLAASPSAQEVIRDLANTALRTAGRLP